MADGGTPTYTVEDYRAAAQRARDGGDLSSAQALIRKGMELEAQSAQPVTPVTPVTTGQPAETPAPAPLPATPPPAAPETLVEEPESLAKRSTRRAGQELLASPGAIGGLYGLGRAAIDRYINGVPWDEAMLSEEGRDTLELIKSKAPGWEQALAQLDADPSSVLRPGLKGAVEWYDWGGEVTGVTNNPDGSVPLDEEVGGIALSTLLTLPASIVSKPAAAISKISNKGARVALTTALRAAELSTPGTIGAGKYGSNIAANAAVQVAINDVARGLMDEQTLTGTVLNGDDAEEAMIGAPVESSLIEGDEAAAAAAAVGVLAGGAGIKRVLRNTVTDVTTEGTARLGPMPVRDSAGNTIRDVAQDFQSATSDNLNNLAEGLRRTGVSEEGVQRFDDYVRAQSGAATQVARERFLTTGIVDPEGQIRTNVPPTETFRAYDRADKDFQQRFDNYVEAVDELERRARGITNLQHLTDADLRSRVQANGDADVKALADQYFDIGRKIGDYRLKKRVTSATQHAAESKNYMPNISRDPERAGLARLWDRYGPSNTRSSYASDIAAFEKQAEGGISEKVPAMEAMRRYINVEIAEIGQNSVRRAYLNQMAGRQVTDFKQGRRLVSRSGKEGGTPVSFMEDGEKKTMYVGDKRIAHALQFTPHAVAGFGFNTTRRWFQQGTTGALNPLFAPISLAYDAFAGMLGGRTGRVVTGMLDDRLARMGMSESLRDFMAVLRPLDTLGVVGEGLVTGVTGRFKEEVARQMLRRSGGSVSQAAADAAAEVFVNSRYGMMQMQGYSANMLTEALQEMDENVLDKVSRRVGDNVKRTFAGRLYMGVQDVVRDAYRMGMFSRNYSHQQWLNKQGGGTGELTQAQLRKIVNHVREVGVDPQKRGASDLVNVATSAVPYGNITLQSANHLVRNIMTNPGARATAMSLVMTAWAAREAMSPEGREYYDTRVPDYRRATSLTFEWPRAEGEEFDPDKHLYHMPLGPEMGFLVHGTTEGLHAMMGEAETGDPTMAQRMKSALFDMLVPGMPPMLQAAAAAAGKGEINAESAMRGDGLFREPQMEGNPELRGVGQNDGWITDKIAGMVSAMFGSFGQTVMDSAEVLDMEAASPDPSFRDGMRDALEVITYETLGGGTRVGTLWSDTVREHPRGTPLSNQAYSIRNMLDEAAQFGRDLVPSITEGPLDKEIPYEDAVDKLPTYVRDPALKQQAMAVRAFFKTPAMAHSLRDLSQLRARYFRAKSNTDVGLNAKNTQLQTYNEQMHERYEQMVQSYGLFEQRMMRMSGDPSWSIDKFIEAARKDIYSD